MYPLKSDGFPTASHSCGKWPEGPDASRTFAAALLGHVVDSNLATKLRLIKERILMLAATPG